MEGLAMLGQLIGHFQELCELYGSNATPSLSSSSSSHSHYHHRLLSRPFPRGLSQKAVCGDSKCNSTLDTVKLL